MTISVISGIVIPNGMSHFTGIMQGNISDNLQSYYLLKGGSFFISYECKIEIIKRDN